MKQVLPETKVFEGDGARLRLVELGLDHDLLVEVVRRGEVARASATDNDPLIAASWDAFRHRVRGLRDLFGPLGCEKFREGNLELLRTADGKRALITRAGDTGVGLRSAFPQPARSFGEQTAQALDANSSLLLNPDWLNVQQVVETGAFETWMLLVYRAGDTVRAELSHPLGISNDGKVLRWGDRILLEEIDFGSEDKNRNDNTDDTAEVPDVPVSRRR